MSQTPSSSASYAPPPHMPSGSDQLLAFLMQYGIQLPQLPPTFRSSPVAAVPGPMVTPGMGPLQPPPLPQCTAQGLQPTSAGQKRARVELGGPETDEEEDDGDDEEETGNLHPPRSRRSHRKRVRRSPPKKLLCGVRKENLSPQQLVVRGKLQALVKGELQLLTGIVKNRFPQPGVQGFGTSETGTTEDVDAVRGQSDQGALPLTHGTRVGPPMAFNFDFDVDVEVNLRVIRRAANIVWAEQGDDAVARTVPHPSVKFTQDDIEGFAKVCFRTWRRKFRALSNEDRQVAWERNKRVNRRSERQKQLRDDREKACDEYRHRHGKDVQVLLGESAYMSEEVSDLDDATPEDRQRWRTDLEKAARITEADREEGNIKVLEVVRPACRPAKVNKIFDELDAIRRQQRRADPASARPRFRRVNCGRLRQDPPPVSLYPCLLDADWLKAYQEKNPYEDVYVLDHNPPALVTLIGGSELRTTDSEDD